MFKNQSKEKKTIKGVTGLLSTLLLFCFFASLPAEEKAGRKTIKTTELAEELNNLTLKKELKDFKKEVEANLTFLTTHKKKLISPCEKSITAKLTEDEYKKLNTFFKKSQKYLKYLSYCNFDQNYINRLYSELEAVNQLFEPYKDALSISGKDDAETKAFFDNAIKIDLFLKSYINNMNRFIKAQKEHKPWVEKVQRAIKFVKEKAEPPLEFKIAAGFVGNKAGKGDNLNELYKIDINADLSYNDYPSSFIFSSETGIQLSEGKLDENVNALTLSYGYDINNWFGVNGFVSRSSNSYLSIQHRYEMGAGITFKYNILSKSDQEVINREKENLSAIQQLEEFIKKNRDFSPERKCKLTGELNTVKKEGNRIIKSKKKKLARLTIGLGGAIMSEIEKAAISSEVRDDDNPKAENETQTFELDGEQHFRFLVEPFFRYTTGSTLTVTGQWRWIMPFFGEWTTDDGRRGDYRNTLKFQIAINLPQKPNNSLFKKVTLILEYQRSFDNTAPRIPESEIENRMKGIDPETGSDVLICDSKTILTPNAVDSYDKYGFKISIEF